MPGLRISHASKAYAGVPAVSDISLGVDRGDLACLLGPSGCGKTTLLRLVAGLDPLDAGSISFDGADLAGREPYTRGFGLMFQDLALFPHMDVFGNVAFGLRMQQMPRAAIRARVEELLALVDLDGYGKRKAHELSGGERQRVALARSLAPEPKLLMLDEPLGSLDRVLRDSLQAQIRSILKQVGVTAIYVTHDRDEAFAIADTIVVMDRGAIAQAGPPEALFAAPANELVARSMGIRNILPGVLEPGGGSLTVTCAIGSIPVTGPAPTQTPNEGGLLVLIDERAVTIEHVGDDPNVAVATGAAHLTGVVLTRSFRGGESELRLGAGQGELICVVGSQQTTAAVGDEVRIIIPREAARLLPAAVRA